MLPRGPSAFFSNDVFRCTDAVQTNYRRRSDLVSNAVNKCKVIYKTGSQNTDKHHDGQQKALIRPNDFQESQTDTDNDWMMQCDESCDTCAAGINMGLDLHKCCPDVTFDATIPTDAQIDACHAVDQSTVDLSQCGSMTAKCKTFVVWMNAPDSMTQVLTGAYLATYEADYGTSSTTRRRGNTDHSTDHYPWRYTMWKHSVCKLKGGTGNAASRSEQTCTTSKKCLCRQAPWQLPSAERSCSNAPEEVTKMAAVMCGQF